MKKNTLNCADKVRVKVLKAAAFCFIRKGYAGTSIDNIMDKAKVTRSLIFHHFQNKRGLWHAVKQYLLAE